MQMTKEKLAAIIDHTLLKPFATRDDIAKLCKEALNYGFVTAVVNPTYVPLAAELLRGSKVKVCTVVGFPLGASTTKVKAFETANAIEGGAKEIDMVINVGALKSHDFNLVSNDIAAVVREARSANAITKVIIEACYLTREEKIRACELARGGGADFVKTSTGFAEGAREEDVRLMRQVVGENMGVKASGGIRTYEDAVRMVEAGATRIGTSAGVAIISGLLEI